MVDLIDTIGGRWQSTTSDNEHRVKRSFAQLFAKDSQKIAEEEMEEFDFELLKADLLTQPMEKDGNQLTQRNVPSWIRNVS